MKKSYIKESFDRYINLLVKKSFGLEQINEFIVPAAIGYGINKFIDKNKDKIKKNIGRIDITGGRSVIPSFKNDSMSGGVKIPKSFKGDAMSGNRGNEYRMDQDIDPKLPYYSGPLGTAKKGGSGEMHKLPHKMDAFPFYMAEYKTKFESSKNIDSFLYMLQKMDDERIKKNIDILADAMISSPQNTQANRDFEKNYKPKGITTKEQLVQVIYKEVMDRKNYRPDPNR